MPSFANDGYFQTATATTTSPQTTILDGPPRKSHETNAVSGAFLWSAGANGDNGHIETPPDHHHHHHQFGHPFKNGSLQSLPATNSSPSIYSQDRSLSKNESMLSTGSGNRCREYASNSMNPDGPVTNGSPMDTVPTSGNNNSNGVTLTGTGTMVNGVSSKVRSPKPKPPGMVNGHRSVPQGDTTSPNSNSTTASASASASAVAATTSTPQADGVVDDAGPPVTPTPIKTSQELHRYSSPPPTSAPSNMSVASPASPVSPIEPTSPGQQIRPTLQVPKAFTGRRNSRDIGPSNVNPSDDNSDRISSPNSVLRRASVNLARRATRSIHSDGHLEDAPPDEDAARWAEAIKQKRASRRKRRDEEEEDRVIVGTKVDQHHVNWVTAYNMLTGIRFTVSRTNAKMDRELTQADFDAKHKFSFDITGNELTPSAKYDFKFKDYAPWVFRRLRAKFKLDPADYLMSLTSKYILSELGSPGKSGSFFYFSRDYKYIIKTIHHAEHKLLRKILRDYYEHIENNPNTLISQFYGLHRVKMAYGRKIHFVVMNNLFPPHRDIHQMFDLKGSTIGRDFREDDLEKNPRATLKDLNWLRRNRHLEFGPMKKDVFVAQLRRDVKLLQKLKIMDYSLLVGVHDLEKGNEEKLRDKTLQIFQPGGDRDEDAHASMLMRTPSKLENARKARELREIIKKEKPVPLEQTAARMPDEILDERKNLVFYSDDGGFRATHENNEPGEEIYYLGIIDCLTHYGMTKKAENFWKGLSHSRSQISPIPPESYGERFINFITGTTMSKEEGERQKQSKEQGREQREQQEQGHHSMDTLRSSFAFPRHSADRAAEKAEKADRKTEKQVAKSERTLESDPEPQERVLRTMRTPSMDGAQGQGTSTLPVVEEVGEGSNTGRQSGGGQRRATVDPSALPTTRERTEMVNGDVSNRDQASSSYSDPNDVHSRQEHPISYQNNIDSVSGKGKGKAREVEWENGNDVSHMNEKRLPPIPFQPPPPPPPWRGSDSAYISSN